MEEIISKVKANLQKNISYAYSVDTFEIPSLGHRYELYCVSKSVKSTQCTLHVDISSEKAWDQNLKRDEVGQYSKEVFDGLVMRYEPPDGRNRWDSPLFTIQPNDELPFDNITAALFERKAPPPNKSTQSVSL